MWRLRSEGRLLAAAVVGVALVTAVGCGSSKSGDDDVSAGKPAGYEASTGYLSKVVGTSSHAPARFEMSTSAAGKVGEGEFDGQRSRVLMDFGKILAPSLGGKAEKVADRLGVDDLSLEVKADRSKTYMRSPFLAAAGDVIPSGTNLGAMQSLIDAFDKVGDGWGVIDNHRLQAEFPDLPVSQSVGAMDASAYFKLLGATEKVRELGADTINGANVTGLAAEITLGDMMKAQGVDFNKMIPGGARGVDKALIPVKVWIDGDNHIRRVEMTMGGDPLREAVKEAGEDPDDFGPLVNNEIKQTIDISDYGDTSIKVALPTSDLTDITDDFVDIMRQIHP
jgi:hypothetical protein